MKTLRVISGLSARIGGPPQSSALSTIAALRAGIHVDVAAVVSACDRDSDLVGLLRNAGAVVLTFPPSEGIPKARPWAISIPLFRWLARHATSYDLVHVHGTWLASSLAAVLAASAARIPVVMTPHEALTRYDIDQSAFALPKHAFARIYQLTAVTPVYASDLEANASVLKAARQATIFHPVHVPDAPVRRPDDHTSAPGVTVGFLGRIHPKKNIGALLAAVERTPDVRLLVAGDLDSEHAGQLRAKFAGLEASGRVSWLGFVDRHDLRSFFGRIDLLAMPSHFECFGMAAAEAMAFGLPVLVSNRTGIAEVVAQSQCGWVCATTVDGVAAALQAITTLSASVLTSRGEEARRAAVLSLSTTRHGQRLSAIYEELLRERRRRSGTC